MLEILISIDRAVFLFFNSTLSNPVFDVFFKFITLRNSWIIPGIIAAIFFIVKEKKKALLVLGCLIVTIAISDPFCVRVLKPLFHRFRPCHPSYFIDGQHIFLAGGNFLFGMKRSLSFPSAHAMNWFSGASLLYLFYPKRWMWFLTFAFLVALSRVYVGVHYPSDIVAGAVIGIGIGAGVYFLYHYIRQLVTSKNKSMELSSD
jgi:undecaprenyl-diphosphatase